MYRFACTIMLVALTASVVSAKVSSRTVTFGQDFSVGGTVVKAGTYLLRFDDATNELSVLDKKTKTVLAKAAARMEKSDAKGAAASEIKLIKRDGSMMLASVGLPNSGYLIRISDAVTASVS